MSRHFPLGSSTACMWNRLNLSIVCHLILKMWHEHSFIYVLPWFLLAQASLWTVEVIGNKWDGPVGLDTHAVSAVPWPPRSLHAPHGTTSHQGLQGFSIHSAKTVSSLPLTSIHIPAVKHRTLPTTATQRLDHVSTPVNCSFALPAVSWPTSYSC